MYYVTCMNEKGEKFEKEFVSEFFYRKFLNKANKSKKIIVIAHGRKF